MNFRVSSKLLIALAVVCLLVSILFVGCAKSSAPAPVGSVAIYPAEATIKKGFDLTITGASFQPSERVSFWVVGALDGRDLGLSLTDDINMFVIAGASGTFEVKTFKKMRVPPQTPAGTYTVKAVGETSGTVATTSINIVK